MNGSQKISQTVVLAASIAVALVFLCGRSVSAAELIMFEQSGCHWCERWDDEIGEVYGKTPEGRRAPLRRVDIHERLPTDLKFLAKGRYTPTFVLVDEGKEIGRIRGYPGEDFFWGLLAKMLERLAPSSAQRPKNTN